MRFLILSVFFCLVFSHQGLAQVLRFNGYTYKTVKIGEQEWFAENLKTTLYANGDEIPYSRTVESWTTQEMGMRCSYNHDDAMNAKSGQLYNWFAVDDERGICPNGWHVPTDGEWTDLENYITSRGFNGIVSTALKSTTGWEAFDGNGTDDFGFSALPSGFREDDSDKFYSWAVGYWWSSSLDGGDAWKRTLDTYTELLKRSSSNPRSGFSVRCLRDAD
jgi:uncharacterized protein (TIGR02145 family)